MPDLENQNAEAFKRVLWSCRRGMLELDELFAPFCKMHYQHLSAADKAVFADLLRSEDPELLAWFTDQKAPADPNLKAMIKRIKDYHDEANPNVATI